MIEIIEGSREFTNVEQYLMTLDADMEVIKNVPDGTEITIADFLNFKDIKDTGEVTELTSFMTPEKKVYVVQSPTFIDAVFDMWAIFAGEPFTIIKKTGESKAGRKFVYAVLKK